MIERIWNYRIFELKLENDELTTEVYVKPAQVIVWYLAYKAWRRWR